MIYIDEYESHPDKTVWYMLRNTDDNASFQAKTGLLCDPQCFHISRYDTIWGHRSIVMKRKDMKLWKKSIEVSKTGRDLICSIRYEHFTSHDVHGASYAVRYPVNEFNVPLLQIIMALLRAYYQELDIEAAVQIQKIFRGWRVRRKYAKHRMRMFNELSYLPPRHVHQDFPGGSGYHYCMNRFRIYSSEIEPQP